METTRATGTADTTYDLISVVYHALQGAETCGTYARDAREAGDSDLADFYERTVALYRQMSDEGKELLVDRLPQTGTPSDFDVVDEASEESFPASDSPAY